MQHNDYLASKPRYEILDGLRGVASMMVVAYHLFETYSHDPLHQILNHGYLAVDFFFVLSGFVIGYAYDDRWTRMTLKDFFKRRLVRLHPMVIMGTLIGALLFYFGDCSAFPSISETPWWKLLLLFLLSCTMIPGSYIMGYTGMGRNKPIEWPYVVVNIGIYRKYSLCTVHPAFFQNTPDYLCDRNRIPDNRPDNEFGCIQYILCQ